MISQLFEYKNQVEVKAVFIPLLKSTATFNSALLNRNTTVASQHNGGDPYSPSQKELLIS